MARRVASVPRKAFGATGWSLALVVFAAIAPLVAFAAFASWTVVQQKQSDAQAELVGLARAIRVAVDRELKGQFSSMQVAGTELRFNVADNQRFALHAKRILADKPEWASLALIDPVTKAIVFSEPALHIPGQQTISPQTVETAVQTREPAIAGVFPQGKVIPEPLILLMAPVMEQDQVRYVIGVALRPAVISAIFTEQKMVPTWTGAVLDRDMRIAGRSRAPEKLIGMSASPTLIEQVQQGYKGMFLSRTADGEVVSTAYERSATTGWTVAIGIPQHELDGPIQSSLLRFAGVALLLVSSSLAMAYVLGRRVIRSRNAYEAALQAITQEQEIMLNNDMVGIIKLADRKILWHNKWVTRNLGYSDAELDGQSVRMLYPDSESYADIGERAYVALDSRNTFRFQAQLRRKDGSVLWLDISGSLLGDNLRESLWILVDITQAKNNEQTLEAVAQHDELTQLPNRRMLQEGLQTAIATARRTGGQIAICYLDLDGFKAVNDQYGHTAGDQVLRVCAQRMTECVRASDLVTRVGGDEFVLLLCEYGTDPDYATVLERLLAAVRRPILIEDGHTVVVKASIGVSFYPQHGDQVDTLVALADEAMYEAKTRGKDCYVLCEEPR
ncbi:diguanylate cyclase [Rhodoferax sp. GW822-FHT02A01]|uniref:diguanylate cyclase domain-containing protein n=1 Tax=Rhodoferax sp. GW822-FHT02A01 TaxID=3141537 RepID=UPI00315C684C